jgi:hypothetical protein
MLFSGTANPEQLAVMSKALNAYVGSHNIVDEEDRTKAAQLVLLMFGAGAQSVKQLTAALEKSGTI